MDDGSVVRDDVAVSLRGPVTAADVIGAYKVLAFRNANEATLERLIGVARAYKYNAHQVFLTLLDCPEVADTLGIGFIRDHTTPIPLRMDFGAIVLGHVWDAFISDVVRRTGSWEPHIQDVMRTHVRSGDVALDIGANIGCHAALLCELVGRSGQVHAFEPVSYNFDALRRMKELNGYVQLSVHRAAADKENGFVGMSLHPTNSGGCAVGGDSTTEVVRSVALDSYLELPRLDFIKIDIEGHEPLALEGAAGLIERYRPTILTEFAPICMRSRGHDPHAYIERFFDLGLQVSIVGGNEFFDPRALVEFVERTQPLVDLLASRSAAFAS
jgi:FkbM family methyltransferase